MASVRFIRNLNLKVTYEGEEQMVPFAAGDTFQATLIEVDPDGYCDIHMPDGSVIQGVAAEVFENKGKHVPVKHREESAAQKENFEIEVEEEELETALLDGQMRSSDDATTVYEDAAE